MRSRLRVPRFSAIWVATAVLFAISPLLAGGSVSRSALLSMLPFAAILAIAGIGQTLVIQQRGLDLSVPGMITLTTILVTRIPDGHDDRLPKAIGVILLACIASGLISGIAVSWFSITPLVATLGVNALLQGVIFQITSGASTSAAPPGLAGFALDKTLGIPNAVLVAVAAILLVAGTIRATVVGRRFVAVGASPAAAHAAGVRVKAYEVATYVFASITYGAAGILVAGFLGTPGIGAGNDYLLPTIAAVVLGGTSLVGRRRQRRRDRRRRALPDTARAGRARHGSALVGPVRDPGLDHRARHGHRRGAVASPARPRAAGPARPAAARSLRPSACLSLETSVRGR